MTSDLEQLDRDIIDLLDAEKRLEEPPIGASARVFSALAARIGPPGGGGNGDGDGGGSGGDGAHPSVSPFAPLAHAPRSLLRALAPLAGAFAAGGIVVGTIVAASVRPAPVVVYRDRVVVASAAPAPPSVPAETPTPPSLDVAPARSTLAPPPPPAPTTASSGQRLAAERALLDVARDALANGEPDKAVTAVSRHEREFPHGVLAEEREAIAIKALVMAGRGADARARAAAFRVHFPNSISLHSVESSLGTVP